MSDVGFDEQIGIVGHDTSIEPWYEMGPNGWVIYGGDILTQFSGNYHDNLLARTTGQAMMPIFEEYNLRASHVRDRQGIQGYKIRQAPLLKQWTGKVAVQSVPDRR